jgi:LPS-assembly protein
MALLVAFAARADPPSPPIGYVGVVPREWSSTGARAPNPSMPPIGYVGVVPASWSAAAAGGTKTTTLSAPNENRNMETLITADHMSFDQNTNIATALGHVEIARAGYVLHADKVVFDKNKNVMHAEGHVAMLHPDGEVSFDDQEDITGDMKNGVAENLGVLFPDNSRLAARAAERFDGRYLVANKGSYTACNVCMEDPSTPPLWQLRANEIVHDNVEHDIYYHDATLDFLGQPVLYTPYLSMPDPTVERRQGFLSPLAGVTPEAGYFARVPYYFDISADKDATFEPIFSTQDKLALGGEYRERFANGSLSLDSTLGYSELLSENTGAEKGDYLRGDLQGKLLYDINNTWRAGSEVDYVSDKSYLERYDLGAPGNTLSRAYLEDFQGRNYASINTYYFQDLAPGTQPVQPAILPQANFNMLGEPGQTLGGRWSLNGGMLVTSRDNNSALPLADQGPETRRLDLSGGWQRQLISDTGLVTNLNGLVRGDTYWADNVINPNGSGQVFNNVLIGRQFEQANITESYPLGRHGDGYQQTIEPLVMFTAAPNVKPDSRQPIEDSLDVQFDETNLFAPNRFTGDDLIEGGDRVTYGVRQSLVADGGAHFDIFGGQSYDFTHNSDFPALSGLQDNSSDYVGRISASPGSWLDSDWGFRFSHKDLSPEAQDAHLSFGEPIFRPSLRYVLAYQTETTGQVDTIEEAIAGFSSVFMKNYTITFSQTQAFQPDPGPRQTSATLNYANECFIAGVAVVRNDFNRFDIKPGTNVLFHIYLKNLGGVHTDSNTPLNFPAQFRQTD